MRVSIKFWFVIWCAIVARGAIAADDPPGHDVHLAAKLDAVLHSLDAGGAVFSARVIELPSGRELYAHDADRPVMPASNGKLANAAAALDHFGPRHTFKTWLAIDGDDLWLIGCGDPGCGDERIAGAHHAKSTTMLDEWADALKSRGATRIKGKLYFDDGVFDDQRVSPTWSKDFLTDWYAAPVTGLTFNDNCIDVTVYPTEPGKPGRYEVVPPTSGVKIVNETRTAREGEKESAAIARDPSANTFTLTGIVSKKTRVESKPIVDPGAFFADALRTNLKSHGITIDGPTERASRMLGYQKWPALHVALSAATSQPSDPRIVAIHETSMADVLARIDKNSQNLFAEAICKLQGRDWNLSHGNGGEPGSWQAGGLAIHDFLRRNKIDDAHYVLTDGSGLSRENRVTTRLLTDLLALMSRHRYADEFRNSLSISGKDGTLRSRLTDLPAGSVRGKTGSIGGVRSISGYVTTRSGATLAFSIIFNDLPRGQEKRSEDLADNACRILFEWPRLENPERERNHR